MKRTSGGFAVLISVAMTGCLGGAPDSAQGDEPATTDTLSQAAGYNGFTNKQYSQCIDAPGGAFNVMLKLASPCYGNEMHWTFVPVGPANMAGLRGPERSEPGQPGVLLGRSEAGEGKLATPGSWLLPGVSAGLPKAFSNGFGSLERLLRLWAPLK